jgi:hypothetical protein
VKLVTVFLTKDVVTKTSSIRKTKHLSGLLTNRNTRLRSNQTIELSKLVRIGERLERGTELLSRDKVEVLNVVCVDSVGLGPTRTLCDSSKTVPSNASSIDTGNIRNVENAVVYTSLIKTFSDLIPNKCGHGSSFLEEKIENIMVEVFSGIKSIE